MPDETETCLDPRCRFCNTHPAWELAKQFVEWTRNRQESKRLVPPQGEHTFSGATTYPDE